MPIAGTTTLFLEAVTGRAIIVSQIINLTSRTTLLHDNYDLQHQLSSFNLLVSIQTEMTKARTKKPVNVYKKERLTTCLLIKAIPILGAA